MQRKFRAMAKAGTRVGGQGLFYDHHEIPLFHRMKEELLHGDSACAGAELGGSVAKLVDLSANLQGLMARVDRGAAMPGLDELRHAPVFA